MTLSVSLSPDAEAKLVQRAAAAGEDPTALAARLLEWAISDSRPANHYAPGNGDGTTAATADSGAATNVVREFDEVMEELLGMDVQPLPDATTSYSRADIYFDHD